ncbi:SdrD B-like domain-containing protein [Agromyces sp. NPDC060279]|uniref:SdrD B-like domain-containing protein n=1 Tax=Agromyces sp. NPDC060279 TaxID=3347092 RepID=UPI00364DBCA7
MSFHPTAARVPRGPAPSGWHRLRRVVALAMSTTLAVGFLALVGVATPASAAEENGYVFNDAWTLVDPGSARTSNTAPAHDQATNEATSSLPTRTGAIGITARVTPGPTQLAGTNFLTNPRDHSVHGASSAMFLGAPTPANLPGLGVLTNASNCDGGPGSAEHQNFSGNCADTMTLTLSFDRAVTDPVLDVSGIGGWGNYTWNSDDGTTRYGKGSFNSQVWELISPDVTMTLAGDAPTNLVLDGSRLHTPSANTAGNCNTRDKGNANTEQETPNMAFAGCGSLQLHGTFTEVAFQLDSTISPFSEWPRDQYNTGTAYTSTANATYADGVNGLNTVWGETVRLPSQATDSTQSDYTLLSVRLPQNGSIGDRVWLDANRDGIRGDDEAGIEGVTVELLDESGDPVLDADGAPITTVTNADGNYSFTDLPYGRYKVRFGDYPDGMSPTTPNAGDDGSRDSDADPATGESGVIELDSEQPTAAGIDAGLVPAVPGATDDESRNNPQGTAVTVPVLDNDTGDVDPTSVRIIDPNSGDPVQELVVPGEGTWTVDPDTGDLTFTPEAGFTGNPTPIEYQVTDPQGQNPSTAKVTVTYVPEATDDESLDNPQGTAVTVPVLDNDRGDLDPSTVRITDPSSGDPVDELVIPGEGTWTVDPDTGDITFTPEDGFTGNPTPIEYQVADRAGNLTRATVTITYRAPTPPAGPGEHPGPSEPPHVTPPGGVLAATGVAPGVALGVAALLAVLGAAAVVVARRRSTP